MTKSTITREESVQAVFDLKVGYRLGFADLEILKRVARMALAAMDSEPVVTSDINRDAMRYAWLRRDDIDGASYDGDVYVWDVRGQRYEECGQYLSGAELDAYIDSVLPNASTPSPVGVKGSDKLYDVIDDDGDVVLSGVSFNEAQDNSDGYGGDDLYIVEHDTSQIPDNTAQPAPVVQCPFPCGWDNLNKLAIQDAALVARGLVEGELTTEVHRQAAISNNDRLLKVISACRAAMLNGGKS